MSADKQLSDNWQTAVCQLTNSCLTTDKQLYVNCQLTNSCLTTNKQLSDNYKVTERMQYQYGNYQAAVRSWMIDTRQLSWSYQTAVRQPSDRCISDLLSRSCPAAGCRQLAGSCDSSVRKLSTVRKQLRQLPWAVYTVLYSKLLLTNCPLKTFKWWQLFILPN